MIMKKKGLTKLLITTGLLVGTFLVGQSKVDAASLTFNEDLKGYDATIKTENGKNVLSTRKGTWDLDENTQIFSSKNLKIYLNNTEPVNINSIYSKHDLEFRGSGELTADTNGQFGINVGGYLKAFKYTKNGVGKVVGKGTESGIRAYNEIQMEGGTLEGYGVNYGIWTYNDIKPYYNANLKAVASSENGVGIWAYRDIYAWKGANVYGEGGASGAYTEIAHIQAENGSTIKGVSRNINSPLSALHAQKQMPRAYSSAKVIEEYVLTRQDTIQWRPRQTIAITDYTSIKRNMSNVQNYAWSTNGAGQVVAVPGGLQFTPPMARATVQGVRSTAVKSEPTQLKTQGSHIIQLSNVSLGGF